MTILPLKSPLMLVGCSVGGHGSRQHQSVPSFIESLAAEKAGCPYCFWRFFISCCNWDLSFSIWNKPLVFLLAIFQTELTISNEGTEGQLLFQRVDKGLA
ncbi:unnamed protein product [Lactuca virosa]|uniref:Uncharacterized protein n=1 Tax=Lactuca virosa TaxID=75947 RepID=A0AAU9NBW6_9ASTR|nr:unnamed protein product [Lactuca virosa]